MLHKGRSTDVLSAQWGSVEAAGPAPGAPGILPTPPPGPPAPGPPVAANLESWTRALLLTVGPGRPS